MRDNTTGSRSGARGAGRRSSVKGTSQGRPARNSRYSTEDGSVRRSAGEGSAKRSYRKSDDSAMGSSRRPSAAGTRGAGRNASTRTAGTAGATRGTGSSTRGTASSTRGASTRGARGAASATRGTSTRGAASSSRGTSTRGTGASRGRFASEGFEKKYGNKPSGYRKEETKAKKAVIKTAEDGVRLNKFISNSGICSRREADDYITAGVVSVNDVIITELGTKVYPNDVVKFNGERIKGEEKVYIVMNKPKDFVTTVSDPYAEKTVIGLVQGQCKERVYPVGRLDKATTGVLLLTNDGELADKLTHPSFEKKKIYHVTLDKNVKATDMSQLVKGIVLEDGPIQVDEISYVDDDKTQVGVEIHSGRNRIVRRMFEHFGYKVKKLDRVYFAGLTKKNLRRGQWRFLTEQEVAMLKMGSFE